MLKQPIYYEFNLDARTSPSKLIAISHVDDKYSEVLEVAVKQNDRFVYMGGATVIARMVLHRDKDYLLSDDVACSVNDNGNILIPFDNAVVKTQKGVVKIEVNITRDTDELTLQFPLWVSVTGSILDNAEVTPESEGTIPDLLKDAADALEASGDYDNLDNKPQINGVTLDGDQTPAKLGLQKTLTAGQNITIENDGTISASSVEIPTTINLLKGNGSGGVSVASPDSDYQSPLVSGVNIKTINNTSILGSGNINIKGGDLGSFEIEQITNYRGKNLNVLGDSQTAVNLHKTKIYHDWLKELLGFATVNNYGISGSTIGYNASRHPMVTRYTNMSNDVDFIIVMGGINDLNNSSAGSPNSNVPLGTINDTTYDTFYGALKILCEGLIAKYPTKQILFITPTEVSGDWYPEGSKKRVPEGVTVEQYVNAMIEVCEMYSIPVYDAFGKLGIYAKNSSQNSTYLTDGLHLNNNGHEVLGRGVYNFILGLSKTQISYYISKLVNPWVGKTVTVEKQSGKSNNASLTALFPMDSDFNQGNYISYEINGINATNMGNSSFTSGGIFTDTTGEIANGAFVSQTVQRFSVSNIVTGTNFVGTNTPAQIASTASTPYVKVAIQITGSPTYSFEITKLDIIVNGVKKIPTKLGAFFESDKEIITVEDANN